MLCKTMASRTWNVKFFLHLTLYVSAKFIKPAKIKLLKLFQICGKKELLKTDY